MSKSSKRRDCPAVGREITTAECGENRVSRYACPATCPHNPFAPVNYDGLPQLEDETEQQLCARMFDTAKDRRALQERLAATLEDRKNPYATHAFLMWNAYLARGDDGLTCAERWERAGFAGLKNDQRVALRAKMKLRLRLIEPHRVLDGELTEVVDLLDAEPVPFVIRDRGLAGQAARFAPYLAWAYELPHFHRLSGMAVALPEIGQFEPVEIVTELARHLGGPAGEPQCRLWLAEHYSQFTEALTAVGYARRQAMFAGMDAHFCKTTYSLEVPAKEVAAVLAQVPDTDTDTDTLSQSDLDDDDVTCAYAWFEAENDPRVPLPAGGRVALGRVILGTRTCRLECLGAQRMERLRAKFEAALDRRARFHSASQDDMASQLAIKDPPFDKSLVPPRLLEEPQQIALSSSRVPALPPGTSIEEYNASLLAAQDRQFLDDHIPALDGRTPREAARDPARRPKLIRLLKQRVRQTDERNLRTGAREDTNWMLRELGAGEILFDPPPPRAPLDLDDEGEEGDSRDDWASLPPPPRLPARPFDAAGAMARVEAVMRQFPQAEDAVEALVNSGGSLLDDANELIGDWLTEDEWAFLDPILAQAWFVFVPRGTRPPPLDFEAMTDHFEQELKNFSAAVESNQSDRLLDWLGSGRQPELTKGLAAMVIGTMQEPPPGFDLRPEAHPPMLVLLKTVVDELDRTLRH